MCVDDNPAAIVGVETSRGEIELGGRTGAADRIKGLFGDDRLATVEVQLDASAMPVSLGDLQLLDVLVKPQGGPIFAQMVAKRVGDFRINKGEQPLTFVNQRDTHAQGREDAGLFAADNARPDDRQGPRQSIEMENVFACKDPLAVKRDMWVAGRFRANSDDNVAGIDGG